VKKKAFEEHVLPRSEALEQLPCSLNALQEAFLALSDKLATEVGTVLELSTQGFHSLRKAAR